MPEAQGSGGDFLVLCAVETDCMWKIVLAHLLTSSL
jgi:hypothetical protein